MTILDALTPSNLAEVYDVVTLSRAIDYVHDGRLSDPVVAKLTHDTVVASAVVSGTLPSRYITRLYAELAGDDLWVTSTCTCPVHVDCKHGAALALVLGTPDDAPAEAPTATWHQQLARVLDEIASVEDRRDPARLTPLALEVWPEEQRRGYYYQGPSGPVLKIRPVRRGSRGRWVKTGADWRTLSRSSAGAAHPAEQLDALRDLHAALQVEQPYWHVDLDATVTGLGRRAVPLLQRAVDAGVTLVPAGGLSDVRLLRTPVDVVADLAGRTDGGLDVRVGVRHDGRLWRGAEVLVVGTPGHTVGLVSEAGVLTLAGTTHPVPSSLQRMVEATVDLEVPADDTADLTRMLTPLARVVPVVSSDESVPVPDPVPPVLGLTVTWHSSTDAELGWSWRYGEDRCPLGSRERMGGLRDRAAEQELLERVPEALLRAERLLGGDALALAVHDLPALREIEGLEVVEEQRPDFRETDAVPQIAFDVVAAPPGERAGEQSGDPHTDWLDLEVTITVEGERLLLADVLAALTRGEEFLVLPSGLFLRTDRPELDRLREVVRAAAELREPDGDRLSVGRHDLGVWGQLADLGVVDAQAAEWVRRAQALRDLVDLPRPEPTGLVSDLRPYQRDGFHWLAFLWEHGLGGILADDMGLGKTLQVLALVSHAVSTGEGRPFLVVAPTSVVTAWESEAARHAPDLRVRTIRRGADDVAAVAAGADVVVTTYALLRLGQERYAGVGWGGLVLDEAQQVKNHRGKTYGAVRSVDAPFRLAVTGTPFENRLMELWALLSITTPGLYPWPRAFTQHVVRPVEKEKDEAALQRFRQRIRPFLLRRTKELVAAELPPKQEQVLPVVLAPRHRKIYDAHFTRERQRILGLVEDFERNRVAIFSALTKLRQLALDPALVDPEHDAVGSAKIDLLVEHVAEITAEGHRALVFSQFTSFLRRVEARLAGEGIATTYLDGTTRDRAAVIEEFRSGLAPVFLISLKAGGVGLTLTEADYVFVLDPWWNPAAEAQAVDRAHRIGQTQHVHVYRLIADDTIEEKVVELKGRKAELFAQVIDGGGGSAAGITADDIRALFEDPREP
ncbi:MAG: DEAD/DEAH box helicase [Nocardioides sp.]|nr:DEAD/DEAH box helicase [Nocardioidaceae bacterium]MCB8955638.1 DEAD/DEAH box helicase [Nocardioides sp.]